MSPSVLGTQEQARRDRVNANRQDPAQTRICVPIMTITGESYRLREKRRAGALKVPAPRPAASEMRPQVSS